jgi:POT family proton-dependent oligopeptide transporter
LINANQSGSMPLVRSPAILIGCTALGRGVHVRYVDSETRLLVSPLWFVATDLFRSWRELMPSPIGLSYVARVALARYASRLTAAWFVEEAAGNKLAGSLATYSETIQAGVFYAIFVAIAMVSKVALLMATPVLKRLTAES